VLFPARIKVSRSLRKTLRKGRFQVSFDQVFPQVIRGCAGPRQNQPGTWIVPEMMVAYETLHELGQAHSVEVWQDDVLVGGLYGVAIGKAFFGESMFSRVADASKVALVALCRRLMARNYAVIDCQVRTEHLIRLGATEIPRRLFLALLSRACRVADHQPWARPAIPTNDED
jgi:leucyl/phenylalanyl-tRNA--protein transferase